MPVTTVDEANRLRWDGRRGFYEVYYLKFNDRASQTAGWLRYTLTSPEERVGPPYCELWGIFFDAKQPERHFAVRHRYPIEALHASAEPFRVRIGEGELTANRAVGEIGPAATGPGMAWDLAIASEGKPVQPFPADFMYDQFLFPKTKILVAHQNAAFTGRFTAGRRTINLDGAPGQQTHLWGTRHARRWAWGHCNSFVEQPDAVWEGLDAQIKLGPGLPHFKYFYLRAFGEEHLFNTPREILFAKSSWQPSGWDFTVQNPHLRVVGTITCRPENFVAVGYMDPDGSLLYCHNSKISDLRLTVERPGGQALGTLHSPGGCAVEFVDRLIYPGMRAMV